MEDPLLQLFRQRLPTELSALLNDQFDAIFNGDYQAIFQLPIAQKLLDFDEDAPNSWMDHLSRRIDSPSGTEKTTAASASLFLIGYTSLLAFLQSTVTGPPLKFDPATLLLGKHVSGDRQRSDVTRRALIDSLAVDGVAAYRLTPNIELFCLARAILESSSLDQQSVSVSWARLRATFIHQRLLAEPASSLQENIYSLLDNVKAYLEAESSQMSRQASVEFALEQASIETYYANDKLARSEIAQAADERLFEFALTGKLGKRTKFQINDISQLVVLARSHESTGTSAGIASSGTGINQTSAPKALDLNDDTLLESISFSKDVADRAQMMGEDELPSSLSSLDPADQPRLEPLDSIILLALASAITNTSPADGLTREETLPYATRVLDGGSSNWQIYTQALLVRSRIEGYRSRTVERGLLQLQAVVDQVIVETTASDDASTQVDQSSFLPRPKESEAAPASERLRYIFQLASPARWELEAELAQRWVTMGGLRSALEIYERLEMWAEAALCWAATDREDKASKLVRKLLYEASSPAAENEEDERWEGPLRDPLPSDAPRLFCILGDIDHDPTMYERAWEVSKQHYARAQRSLGRLAFSKKDYLAAAAAYSKSLNVNKLNHSSWFALGCALLELEEYGRAAESFTRCVQLDDHDAEAWSNLAAALLRRGPFPSNGDADANAGVIDQQRPKQDALRALKRAATLKHDSYQIWENVLIVAASLTPPDLSSAIAAQSRIVDLRGASVGEACVDAEIMSLVVRATIAEGTPHSEMRPGPQRMLAELFDRKVQPLITSSGPLWALVAQLALWRDRPASALAAYEKRWRAATGQPNGWETGKADSAGARAVVDATVELCEAYESLGMRASTEGLGGGQDGVVVAKDWRFKARSALRSVMGKTRDAWEGSEAWERLEMAMAGLKSPSA